MLLAGFLASAAVAQPQRPLEAEVPSPGEVIVGADRQEVEGRMYRLRGDAWIQTPTLRLSALEVDYNEETGDAEARGEIHFQDFEHGTELWAERAAYNVRQQAGRFYGVRGSAQAKIDRRPGILSTTNPFHFEGRWAEKTGRKYILHEGLITNCNPESPWWTLRASRFDIIPQDRALAYQSVFRLRFVPLFYSPVFYKAMKEQPRKSGFLTPNIGNSSRRGKMLGLGYYWAINRSYDATYRAQWFTQRGLAHNLNLRGKPTSSSDFNVDLYGVDDQGEKLSGGYRRKDGGLVLSFEGQADLGAGFFARAETRYLTSMRFRRAFTESFNEAIDSEVHSTGYVGKHWSSFGLTAAAARLENIQVIGEYNPFTQEVTPDKKIVVRKLPEVDFVSRDRQIWDHIPLWVSLESTAGLLSRTQPSFQTRQFLERADFQPRLMSAFRWKGFNLLPSFSIRETHYGSRFEQGRVTGQNIDRFAREFTLELAPPPVARVFNGPKWIGDKVKHVVETRAVFRHAGGIEDFDKLIRFDETELLSNTTELEISFTNRLFAKSGGVAREVLSWQLWQRRYFDPDFGGAVTALDPVTGRPRRNVVLSSVEVTPFSFLDGPRNYSPVVSVLRLSPAGGFGMEWRSDYDPLRSKLVNGMLSADWRRSIWFVSVGHNHVRSVSYLSPPANQFRGFLGVGNDNRRGWNAAFSAIYDYRQGMMQFATSQVTYNTDCCGFSVQYRRFGIAPRYENQFRVSFTVANIGSFGTLKRQERLF